MAWGMNCHLKFWKIWILILIFLFILTRKMTAASTCEVCSTECPGRDECFCKQTTLHGTELRWNNWYGRYERIITSKLYSFLTCEHFFQDSRLELNIPIDNDCKYITFKHSNIVVLRVNSFVDMPSIKEIYLNSSGISQIQLGAFSGISKLQVLHLEDNKIGKLSKGYLNSLISLQILDLHRNRISSIESESFFGLTFLENLDLSQNSLKIVPSELFDPLVNLKVLNLSRNDFTAVSFELSSLQNLERLDLSSNKIEVLEVCFNGLNLSSLYLQDNQILSLNDSCFPVSLTKLFIEKNNLSELSNGVLEGLTELKLLDVSHNNIREISIDLFKDCGNLQVLDMSHNEIDYLKTGVFSGVPHLIYLNISHTKMKNLEPHTFIPLNELKIFDFDNIDLDEIDSNIFDHFTNLEKIYISGNHFTCSNIASIISQAKIRNFSVIYEKDYMTENVNGLRCKKKNVTQGESHMNSSVDNKKEKLFNEVWKVREKEIFENISNILYNKLGDIMYSEEASFNHTLDKFSNKQEHMIQGLKIMIESEKADLMKFIQDLYAKKSTTKDESDSFESKSIHKNIEKHFHIQNTKLEDNFMKFSENLQKYIEKLCQI
ncbi:hypothetical protein WA026_004155 [Henosepilachna vigintioctopunctata]|uniref:Uncharacterized protein n=1 Tax=Henosepilachna vigintioctopunctata TaxID=420089 RepID=A0AAW1UGK4_9CUCU